MIKYLLFSLIIVGCTNAKIGSDIVDKRQLSFGIANNLSKDYADKARFDLKNKKAKYYVFGIVMPKKELVDSMRENYNLKVVSKSCVLDSNYSAYNLIIDSFLLSQ